VTCIKGAEHGKAFFGLYYSRISVIRVLARRISGNTCQSNNPLNLVAPFNIPNYFKPGIFGFEAHASEFPVRPGMPPEPIGVLIRGTAGA
jgi:hypothetical protein